MTLLTGYGLELRNLSQPLLRQPPTWSTLRPAWAASCHWTLAQVSAYLASRTPERLPVEECLHKLTSKLQPLEAVRGPIVCGADFNYPHDLTRLLFGYPDTRTLESGRSSDDGRSSSCVMS